MTKYVEAGVVYLLVGFLRMVPLVWARRSAEWVGAFLHRVLGIRRRVVRNNLKRSFPEMDPTERDRIEAATYRFFARIAVDWVRCPDWLPDATIRQAGWRHIERWEDRGVIAVTGHLGFWELAAAFLSRRMGPTRVYVDVQSNPYTQRLISSWRERYDVQGVSGPNGLRALTGDLRRNHVVGLLADERPRGNCKYVPFFHHRVRTSRILPFLARKSGAVVVPALVVRGPTGNLRLNIYEPLRSSLSPVEEGDEKKLLLQYNHWLEERIREYPEQYFWLHKRWKDCRELRRVSG